jgi:branched-chain amino acid transport system ATP-binding protein
MTNSVPHLVATQLEASYGESKALHGVTFQLARGELVSLLGRNGAGKTTVLKSIMGLIANVAGSIKIDGVECLRERPFRIARRGVGYCPEERAVFSSLSVRENLDLPPAVRPGGLSTEEIFQMFPRLLERASSQGTKLSGGEQQILAISRTLRSGADLLLLDEPTEGLAPVIVKQIGELINSLKARGMTILLVEQNFKFACSVASRHLIVERGQIVDEFHAADVSQGGGQIAKYLGV